MTADLHQIAEDLGLTKPTKEAVDSWIQAFTPVVSEKILDELVDYSANGMLTAPPQMCGVSADVLWCLVQEIKSARALIQSEIMKEHSR